mgnify:CR=1 FL=1
MMPCMVLVETDANPQLHPFVCMLGDSILFNVGEGASGSGIYGDTYGDKTKCKGKYARIFVHDQDDSTNTIAQGNDKERDRLIAAIAECESVCEHLHLPVQAGDDLVLRRMGRQYTVDAYLGLVERLRAAVPGIALTTDVIVGFCGETDAQGGYEEDETGDGAGNADVKERAFAGDGGHHGRHAHQPRAAHGASLGHGVFDHLDLWFLAIWTGLSNTPHHAP